MVDPDQIRNWTYTEPSNNQTFQGFELFFTEKDVGNFGTYRCLSVIEETHFSGVSRRTIISEPFTILVKGTVKRI